MGVLGVASSTLLNFLKQTTSQQTKRQQFPQEFSQLGQDLICPRRNRTLHLCSRMCRKTARTEARRIRRNLSAAQQDYTTIQQDFNSQNAARQSVHGHHHHEHNNVSNSESSALNQLFSELGSALQSGNLSNAQQYYSTLAHDLQQFTGGSAFTSSSGTSAAGGVSTTA